ncbi:Domain X [Macleaya cordata]|uniref:Domain X n=1 Tax=Macleaya cordata TaxID=56857 RepID=A0A200QKA2_MACCD|nr:Domain X [Macleaya cordata]
MQAYAAYSTLGVVRNDNDKGVGMSLAKSLASVLDESPTPVERRPLTRMELKRLIESRIKKRVKEQYINGKFHDLLAKVIATPKILRDAYDCIRLDSNVDLASKTDDINFESMAEDLSIGGFDIKANTFSIATKGEKKEVLILPNLKLKVVQEAIKIVVKVVYRPHFSKISHGYRSGRGHRSALRYISKEICNLKWWFTLHVKKKVDATFFTKLISTMEEKIEDPSLYSILQNMFDAQVLNLDFGGFPKGQGLPQEGVLSPTLMNIYLDLFDQELYRMRMKYEALGEVNADKEKQHSTLRRWFRRQLKDDNNEDPDDEKSSLKLHACRFMDEIFVAISGSKVNALEVKSDIQKYLQNSLHLDMDVTEVLPIDSPRGIQFLGTVVRIGIRESPAVRAVHKLKDKVRLFALQKQEIWDVMAVRIGKKSLGHGLKKVKESEIKQLADSSSVLNQISHLRKAGMETDHWFKVLVKIWMQDVNAKAENSEEAVLAKYIAEPALPQELRDSFYNFQKHAEEYVLSETASTLALLPVSSSTSQSTTITEILAPVGVIKKRLVRYGLVNSEGYPRPISALILQDNIEIIDWFSGLVRRWLKWFSECTNFGELELLIMEQVRMSCIRTLAAKHRIHESEIEKRFESELSGIPSTQDLEVEMVNGQSDSWVFDEDEALNYGISHCGLCLLSLSRMVTPSRPCNCFIMGCLAAAPSVYTLHVMERQKFPGWKTGFSVSIHPSLNRRRIGLCKQHVKDLYMGHISLQSIDFGSWK